MRIAGTLGLDSMSNVELEQYIADLDNKRKGNLTGYDCPKCLNRGYFSRVDEHGYRIYEPCSCMEIRKSLRAIEKSGLKEMMERYTLENWRTVETWQKSMKEAALRYIQDKNGWFVVAGSVGAGKTHICTALCGELLKQGIPVKYILWRDFSTRAKAAVNDDEEYQSLVTPLKQVRVLYLDDFLKTGRSQEPTIADLNLAFEIINSRYNDTKLLTVISSERTIEEILSLDEAVGSRIYQRAGSNYFPLKGKKNWRLG